jgi:hypothetical protein
MMWFIARFVEQVPIDWSRQFLGFVYGDILLALAFAIALSLRRYYGESATAQWLRNSWVHLVAFVGFVVLAVWRWSINDYNAYSVGQMASPRKIWHDLLFALLGYLLFAAIAPLIGGTRLVIVCLLLVTGWAWLGILDGSAGWKTQYAHVNFEWPVKDFVLSYLDPILRK